MNDSSTGLPFLKGHGAENDFVIVPDPDGAIELAPEHVRLLCDRYAGIGGDGVLHAVRSAKNPEAAHLAADAEWFMDYRNSDGSVAEMCGNGVRVFVRHLLEAGLAEPGGDGTIPVATRAGLRRVRLEADGRLTVFMGRAELPDSTGIEVAVGDRRWPARKIDMGNPHAVAFVDDLAQAGHLLDAPSVSPADAYPEGVNVEFVADRGPRHVAVRVHERGSGETRACGTGACAVMVAAARRDGLGPEGLPATYRVDMPGGTLEITEHPDGQIEMTGPAVIVAAGTTTLVRQG
ncbi:diaminopimelate epimerase [Mangrovactinospora gilvigrisea]|uniref:Diaminopimelate epimerase n=1 Tax=Mangrovactinospora gilvigrisea TaxID=1428644 RepID=A0A1J7BCP5_9ACTN|nr:diaminopimelate epimerase [Mangrovactinospora gilvigrisea]OIV36451.1 diaminopimelate epimerase [Mangrovactinospora gilvigrisea]